ncbi:MAG: 16S rRNA (uracil(1498)-N(3))-methyltransferase [Bdellovibrionales bacterium]|nr:16S rRNA (uracil(1498)-N(3))-methyltransferase [Bdellovibrionales bacterium]
MRRYWLPADSLQGDQVTIDGDAFHHIFVVCRRQQGHHFEVLLPNGQALLVEVEELTKKKAFAKVLEKRQMPYLKEPHIHLALSLPKFSTLEKVIEKSVELGVHSLHLFHSDYSFMKAKPEDLKKKTSRWQKIVIGACQQSGRGQAMQLTEIRPLGVLLEEFQSQENAQGLLAYEGPSTLGVRQALASGPKERGSVWLFVGGEGGFSEADIKLFSNYDLLPVSLGDQVLRVETACVTLLGILKYELGHFEGG